MKNKDKEGSFVSHLTELRSRLINSLILQEQLMLQAYMNIKGENLCQIL